MDLRLVYITCSDRDEAGRIAEALVAERLAACANIIAGMQSVYWWQGAIERGDECVLIAKTRADRMEALVERVAELHADEVPCTVGLPIADGNPAFLDWVRSEAARQG
jgi:periplasmic divalent cation tolerance protein